MQPPQQPAPVAPAGANPGYALGRLARALATGETHESPEVRERASRKAEAWAQVFQGMLSGALQVGSPTPVSGVPRWVTLGVLQGGFASGELLAGGPLQPHEQELLARLPAVPAEASRAALNAYYLGEEGFAELRRMLASGCYRIHLPEEGALLVAAWLAERGLVEQARSLLDQIGPWLPRLRFYPVPDQRPLTATSLVHLQGVGDTLDELNAVRRHVLVATLKRAVRVWAPLYERTIELFLETVEGPAPTLQTTPDGTVRQDEKGRFLVEGGWPCQRYPDGWPERARQFLEDYRAERQRWGCDSPKAGFAVLRRHLEACVIEPRVLTGRDVGMVRLILAGLVTRRGLPGGERLRDRQRRQARQAAAPTSFDLARVLAARLEGLPRDEGLASLNEALAPVRPAEANPEVPAGLAIPEPLARKVRRCLEAGVDALVEMGVIGSAEVLARVVPQISSQVRAAGIADPALRTLSGAIYQAFRRRRSLLLLNLASQTRLEDLPWVQAINLHRGADLGAREQARQALEQLAVLAITAFPEQILPNKLLQEVRALAQAAGLALPIVDEVAADIFMGEFSEKFLLAARKAAELLQGTLYERYYGVDYARVLQLGDVKASRHGVRTSEGFVRLCRELAGETGVGRWDVAANGKVIEQEQILTTHNLAVLFDALDLSTSLGRQVPELAGRCFRWVIERLQQQIEGWQPRLRVVKNAAYAWRQMVFFLALLSDEEVRGFLKSAEGQLGEQPEAFRGRFRPALEGLVRAAQGQPVEGGTARRFLGWTTGTHWLMA